MVQQRGFEGTDGADTLAYVQANEAAEYIRSRSHHRPTICLVLGSGLGLLADRVQNADVMPYAEIPHFPHSTVKGHSGRLLIGVLARQHVLVMQGRSHYYEGYSLNQVTLPIRVMQQLGIGTLVVTNAAGGVNPSFQPGDLMAITDHINLPGLAGHHPLRGPNEDRFGPRFPDLSTPYDGELLDHLRDQARTLGTPLKEGTYMMVSGPSFETPAEVRMARALGADAVGMSTAPEVVVARHGGMRVLGISLITNVAISQVRASRADEDVHHQVLEAGEKAVPILIRLVEGVLERIIPAQVV